MRLSKERRMKVKGSFKKVSALALSALFLASCGTKDDASSGGADLSTDSNVSIEVIQSNLQDTLEAFGEEFTNSSSFNLNSLHLLGQALIANSVQPSCETKNDTAVVTIESDLSKEITVQTRRRTFTRSITGRGEQIRTWSKKDAYIGCNGKIADIDWRSVNGLALSLTFSRSRALVDTVNSVKTRSISFDASGSRDFTWTDKTSSDDTALTSTRRKTITSNVVRTFSVTKKDGTTQDLKLTTAAPSSEPLHVTVIRDISDLSLLSKTVDSGMLVATDKAGGSVQSSFSALKIDYSSGTCSPVSGSIVNKFFAQGSTTASATLTATFSDGLGTVTNDKGEEVGTIEQDNCDPEDNAS